MPRVLQRLLALALLALWLPATGHCALGTIFGWLDDACAHVCAHPQAHDDDSAHDTGHPPTDACKIVENGDFKPTSSAALAPTPQLSVVTCLACLHARLLAEARSLAPPAWTKNDPADWVPRWAFHARAALPARAPDLT